MRPDRPQGTPGRRPDRDGPRRDPRSAGRRYDPIGGGDPTRPGPDDGYDDRYRAGHDDRSYDDAPYGPRSGGSAGRRGRDAAPPTGERRANPADSAPRRRYPREDRAPRTRGYEPSWVRSSGSGVGAAGRAARERRDARNDAGSAGSYASDRRAGGDPGAAGRERGYIDDDRMPYADRWQGATAGQFAQTDDPDTDRYDEVPYSDERYASVPGDDGPDGFIDPYDADPRTTGRAPRSGGYRDEVDPAYDDEAAYDERYARRSRATDRERPRAPVVEDVEALDELAWPATDATDAEWRSPGAPSGERAHGLTGNRDEWARHSPAVDPAAAGDDALADESWSGDATPAPRAGGLRGLAGRLGLRRRGQRAAAPSPGHDPAADWPEDEWAAAPGAANAGDAEGAEDDLPYAPGPDADPSTPPVSARRTVRGRRESLAVDEDARSPWDDQDRVPPITRAEAPAGRFDEVDAAETARYGAPFEPLPALDQDPVDDAGLSGAGPQGQDRYAAEGALYDSPGDHIARRFEDDPDPDRYPVDHAPDDDTAPDDRWEREPDAYEEPDERSDGRWAVEGNEGAPDADEPGEPRADVFGAPSRPGRGERGEGSRPPVWGGSGYAWRFARSLTIPRANRLLRFGAGRVLPGSSRSRFLAMGLPAAEVTDTLAQVRSLDDWAEAWTGTAQRFLGEARRGGDNTPADSARARQMAALCYHVAGFFAFGDDRLARTSRSAANTLFAQSLGLAMPETRRVSVRWRSRQLPGYLTVPSWATGQRPLVVLLNGATTSKEEMILWTDEFLGQGQAVLALDTPGFGEATSLGPVSLDDDDLTDGIFELAADDPTLDPGKVALVGISLGGSVAMRAAAADRRVSAVVAVTPPYEPARWIGASSQVSLAQLAPLFGGYEAMADFVLGLDLPTTIAEVQAQVLIFGAGRDLVVPPPEAARMAAAFGEHATLVWFDDAGHALFDAVPDWTREAAEWLAVVMDVADAPVHQEYTGEEDDPAGSEPVAATDEPDGGAGTPPGVPVPQPVQRIGRPGPRPSGEGEEPAWADASDDGPGDVDAEGVDTRGDERSDAREEPGFGVVEPPRPSSPRITAAPGPAGLTPEPYGAGVFSAEEAPARRSEPVRGYETGLFGPLGDAAARILADEPPPGPTGGDQWRSRIVDGFTRPANDPVDDTREPDVAGDHGAPAATDRSPASRPIVHPGGQAGIYSGIDGRSETGAPADPSDPSGVRTGEDPKMAAGEDVVHDVRPAIGSAGSAGDEIPSDEPDDRHGPFRPPVSRSD